MRKPKKPVAFIYYDEPSLGVTSPSINLIYKLALRLGLSSTQFLIIRLGREKNDETLLLTASCVIVSGHYKGATNFNKQRQLKIWLQKVMENGIPLFAYGHAERLLFNMIGGSISHKIEGHNYGFNTVHLVDKNDIICFNNSEKWTWVTASFTYKDLDRTSVVVAENQQGHPLLIRHRFNVYSSPVNVGCNWSSMVSWLLTNRQYIAGNEALLESNRDEQWGFELLKNFILTWGPGHPESYLN